MSGGQQYWNEDTQRWEDGRGSSPAAEPTSPPPARPEFAPAVSPSGWPGDGADSAWHGPGTGGTVVDGAAAGGTWPPSGPEAVGPGGGPAPEWAGGASWPPVEPPSAPAPERGLNRRLVWSVVVGAAVVGVAVSLVLTLVVGKDDEPGKKPVVAGSSVAPSASTPAVSESPTDDTASPSPSAPELPAGYESYDDEEGFRIAIPDGWTRSSVASQYGIAVVNYRSADREHRLQVYQVQEESPDASFKLYLSGDTPKPAGFKKLDLQRLDDGEFTGSRLEYTADSIKGEPDIGTWHVYDERFVAPDGNIYAIAAYGPDSDRESELELLTTALDWFCPPYTTCDADPGID